MHSNDISPKIFAGIDNIIFDERQFDPSKEDIIKICRFFLLGELKYFEKEKGITVSHSNHLVFVRTNTGEYALKFYPPGSDNMLATEFAINRYLIERDFLTPQMHAGKTGRPSFNSNGRLATCFTYIDGTQAWQHIHKPQIFRTINRAMSSIKRIMSSVHKDIPLLKQERFSKMANEAARASRSIPSYDQKELIESILLRTCRSFEEHQPLFERQCLHNNATLTNFLFFRNDLYTLDLTHIREDYILSDLATLVVSCLFFGARRSIISVIIKDHFKQLKIPKEKIVVLNTLVKIYLIREYLKNIRNERSINANVTRQRTAIDYLAHLKTRKKLIVDALSKITTL